MNRGFILGVAAGLGVAAVAVVVGYLLLGRGEDDVEAVTDASDAALDAPDAAPVERPTPLVAEGERDPRDQYALVEAMIAARRAGRPSDYRAVRDSFARRRVRWEMLRVEVLCGDPASCHVVPFDYARLEDPPQLGFLPKLSFAAGAHEAMTSACAGHPQCVITFDGLLDDLVFAELVPTRIVLTDVRFVSARAARPEERWRRE